MRRPLRSDLARRVAALAIDLGDPARMARARRLHRAGAVTGLEVRRGRLDAVVDAGPDGLLSPRLLVDPVPATGELPDATALAGHCTCGDTAPGCVHVLATILSFAEEVEATPELVEDWTASPPAPTTTTTASPEFFGGGGPVRRRALEPLVAAPTPLPDLDAWDAVVDAMSVVADAVSDGDRRVRP